MRTSHHHTCPRLRNLKSWLFFQTGRLARVGRRIKAVYDTFKLPGNAVVVNRGSDHQHIRFSQRQVDFLHVILLYTTASTFCMAILAGHTAFDILTAHIYCRHLMSDRYSPLGKKLSPFALYCPSDADSRSIQVFSSLCLFCFNRIFQKPVFSSHLTTFSFDFTASRPRMASPSATVALG